MDDLFWTDEQWENWGDRTVTVNVEFFDVLATAVELLTNGVRLRKRERANWTITSRECRKILAQERAAVTALAEALGQEQEE